MKDADYVNIANLTRLRAARDMLRDVLPIGPLKPSAPNIQTMQVTIYDCIQTLERWADKEIVA